ncbi:MAG TPA: hypothetical protein DEE98_08835, partial [Elusimicrobia bacterium]|nr:hypothetical protein [Elusimicrobiota bacterium]
MKKVVEVQLAELVDMSVPAAVFEEVKNNFIHFYHISDFSAVRDAFRVFNDLYDGKYPGYKSCNTKFHDKIHTTDALLAISRLIDGYNINNGPMPVEKVKIALIATIMHDTGYVQSARDKSGTGAKYTLMHVDRSIDFIEKYFSEIGLSRKNFISARNMVHCTGLEVHLDSIKFQDREEKILGFMLGSADIMGQMASRTYLERLLYLYKEFKEGHVKGFNSEFELLQKTLEFKAGMKTRLNEILLNLWSYCVPHFKKRYGLGANLYSLAIDRHAEYLKKILKS